MNISNRKILPESKKKMTLGMVKEKRAYRPFQLKEICHQQLFDHRPGEDIKGEITCQICLNVSFSYCLFLLISSLFNTVNPQHLREGVAQDLDPQYQLEGNNALDAPDRNPEVQNL